MKDTRIEQRKVSRFFGVRNWSAKWVLASGFWLLTLTSAQAATWTVTNTLDHTVGPCDVECTLRDAITAAQAGDVIQFAPSVTGTITLTAGQLSIDRNLTITGPGARVLAVSGNSTSRVFLVRRNITAAISGLTIRGGSAEANPDIPSTTVRVGGGIFNDGSLTLVACRITGNTAVSGAGSSSASGGGIYNYIAGTLTMRDCQLSHNVARSSEAFGGGLYNAGTATLTNCTVSTNQIEVLSASFTNGRGAGIRNHKFSINGQPGAATLNLINCTITNNFFAPGSAGPQLVGGGLQKSFDAPTYLRNTIVAGNSAPDRPDVATEGSASAAFLSEGHNLIGITDGSSGWITDPAAPNRDLTGTAAAPLPAGFATTIPFINGGPTDTHALSQNSIAIDAGDDAVLGSPHNLVADQRGYPRKILQHVDIGAFEYDPPQAAPNFVVNTTNEYNDVICGIADCSLWEALTASNANTANNSVITFAPQAYGTIPVTLQPGGMNVTRPVSIVGPGSNLLTLTGAGVARHLNITAAGVAISNLQLAFGQVSGNGGSIIATNGVALTDCVFTSNHAVGGFATGGAIMISGGLATIRDCTFTNNQADFSGGAVYDVAATVTIERSTFTGNFAESAGGALRNTGTTGNATLTATNCTFSGNSTGTFAGATGGAIGNLSGGGFSATVNLTNCTFSGNASTTGGAIYNHLNQGGAPAAVNINNSLFHSGARGANFASNGAVITSQGYNLSNDAAGGDGSPEPGGFLNAIGDKRNTDPLLDPAGLAQNGGPTATIALQPSSPAIDAGNSSLTNDQRSIQRPYDFSGVPNAANGSDIGAFEVQAPPPPTPTPTPTPRTVLGNISTRLRVEIGDDVLFAGMIVSGTQPKRVIIRGTGTSLATSDKLVNPTLELHGPSGLIEANDNWVDSPSKQAIIDSGVAPSNDLEPAIIATLPANNSGYTAILRGVNNGTGIGVIEAYDLDPSADSTLANISTRGLVQTGDNVLFAGTIVVGPGSRTVIVRAIAPSLSVTGKMADPILQLRDQNGAILEENDNWVDSPNKAAILASTIPPSNDLESAIVATLPGNNAAYTAIVRGVNDTTGIALVEVYALQ